MDAPDDPPSPVTLINHPRRHDRLVSPLLRAMRDQYATGLHDGLCLDESLGRLMDAIVRDTTTPSA